MGYYGHVVRNYNSLEKELIQGCTSGKLATVSCGQHRKRRTDDINEWTGKAINDTT